VVIKISDEGGGIKRSDMHKIWSYLYVPPFIPSFPPVLSLGLGLYHPPVIIVCHETSLTSSFFSTNQPTNQPTITHRIISIFTLQVHYGRPRDPGNRSSGERGQRGSCRPLHHLPTGGTGVRPLLCYCSPFLFL
jgi:hypothetical protein